MSVQLNGLGATLPYAGLSPYSNGTERRSTSRIELPFPAIVRGVDQDGEWFTLETVVDNLSACGLYLRLARPVEPRATLFVVVRFAPAGSAAVAAPGVAVRGWCSGPSCGRVACGVSRLHSGAIGFYMQ
jgi:hypothetical protein